MAEQKRLLELGLGWSPVAGKEDAGSMECAADGAIMGITAPRETLVAQAEFMQLSKLRLDGERLVCLFVTSALCACAPHVQLYHRHTRCIQKGRVQYLCWRRAGH